MWYSAVTYGWVILEADVDRLLTGHVVAQTHNWAN